MKLQSKIFFLLLAGATAGSIASAQEEPKAQDELKPATPPPAKTAPASVDKIGDKIRAVNGGSPQATEIAKMSEAGVDEKTILGYIETMPAARVKADDIIYLHERGISGTIITALLQHASAAQAAAAAAAPAPAPAQNPPAQAPQTAPATPVVVEQPPPTYVSSPAVAYTGYPYYGGYYGYPYVSFGFGYPYYGYGYRYCGGYPYYGGYHCGPYYGGGGLHVAYGGGYGGYSHSGGGLHVYSGGGGGGAHYGGGGGMGGHGGGGHR